MEQWKLEEYLLHSKSERFARKIEESKKIIREVLNITGNPYIAFSCGKDSSVLADLILSINKSIPLRFLSSGETRLIHNVDTVLEYFKKKNANITEINIDRVFSDNWINASWDIERKAGRRDMELLNDLSFDGIFMGLRIEESPQRKMSISHHQTKELPSFCYRYASGKRKNFIRCCPIAKWKVIDVGAYLLSKKIPYLKWYEDYTFEGRTTARITGDSVRNNVLAWLKKSNPKSFNILAKRFPEFRLFI